LGKTGGIDIKRRPRNPGIGTGFDPEITATVNRISPKPGRLSMAKLISNTGRRQKRYDRASVRNRLPRRSQL